MRDERHRRDVLRQDAVHAEHPHVRDDEPIRLLLEDAPARVQRDRAADGGRQPPGSGRDEQRQQQHDRRRAKQLEHRPDGRRPVLAHLVDHHLALIGDEVLLDPRIEQAHQPASATKKSVIADTGAPDRADSALHGVRGILRPVTR